MEAKERSISSRQAPNKGRMTPFSVRQALHILSSCSGEAKYALISIFATNYKTQTSNVRLGYARKVTIWRPNTITTDVRQFPEQEKRKNHADVVLSLTMRTQLSFLAVKLKTILNSKCLFQKQIHISRFIGIVFSHMEF